MGGIRLLICGLPVAKLSPHASSVAWAPSSSTRPPIDTRQPHLVPFRSPGAGLRIPSSGDNVQRSDVQGASGRYESSTVHMRRRRHSRYIRCRISPVRPGTASIPLGQTLSMRSSNYVHTSRLNTGAAAGMGWTMRPPPPALACALRATAPCRYRTRACVGRRRREMAAVRSSGRHVQSRTCWVVRSARAAVEAARRASRCRGKSREAAHAPRSRTPPRPEHRTLACCGQRWRCRLAEGRTRHVQERGRLPQLVRQALRGWLTWLMRKTLADAAPRAPARLQAERRAAGGESPTAAVTPMAEPWAVGYVELLALECVGGARAAVRT